MSKLNEIIVSQLPTQSEVLPCTAYLLDNGDGTHDRYVSDEDRNLSKQSSNNSNGIDQENIPKLISLTLEDLGMTSENTEEEINQALSNYINGLNLTVGEKELYFFQVDGFSDLVGNKITSLENLKLDKGSYTGNSAQDLKDEIDNKENLSNKQNDLTSDSTGTKYPTVTAVNNGLDEKLNTPTMTNNYYGLWDDTNKKFINGTLREEADYLQSTLPVKIDGTPIVPKEATDSLFIGTYPQNVSGEANTIFGYKNGESLTSGYGNLLIGFNAFTKMTTGIANITLAGWGAGGYNPSTGGYDLEITGKHNITIGSGANNNITSGSRNVAIGTGALSRVETGSTNIAIGYGSGAMLKTGSNNIFIGSGAGGQSSSQTANQGVSNKLCIHTIVNSSTGVGYTTNPNGFWDTAPSPHGMNTWDLGLITGDFAERWVKFNGKFIIGSGYMPVADTTYTKNIVAKPDGTFGWEDKKTLEINASKGTTFPGVSNPGDLFFNTTDNKHYGFDGTSWNALY